MEIFHYTINFFIGSFAFLRMKALLTNRLFNLAHGTREMANEIVELSLQSRNNYTEKSLSGDRCVRVPEYLDWKLARYKFCICCFNFRKRFSLYMKILDLGYENVEGDMDVIRFIRRLRMHGISMNFLQSTSHVYSSAWLAYKRPLRKEEKKITNTDNIREKWKDIENLTSEDLFLVGLVKKYCELQKDNKRQNVFKKLFDR